MTQPRDQFIDVHGLTIHYLEWGEPDGALLVLVHGFLDQAASWQPFVTSLQNKSNQPLWVVAPDCRGHGDSGWVGAGGYYHFPDYVFDLDCVIRALGVERVKLIGHSMGGTISFLYSGTFPKKVQQLALIEGIGAVGMNFSDAPVRMEKWIAELHDRGRNHFRNRVRPGHIGRRIADGDTEIGRDLLASPGDFVGGSETVEHNRAARSCQRARDETHHSLSYEPRGVPVRGLD